MSGLKYSPFAPDLKANGITDTIVCRIATGATTLKPFIYVEAIEIACFEKVEVLPLGVSYIY